MKIRFEKFNLNESNNTKKSNDEKYSDFGLDLEKNFNKIKGYYDFLYTEEDEEIIYEFYFDEITLKDILEITDFIKNFDGVMVGGKHDDSENKQICIEIKIDIDEIS